MHKTVKTETLSQFAILFKDGKMINASKEAVSWFETHAVFLQKLISESFQNDSIGQQQQGNVKLGGDQFQITITKIIGEDDAVQLNISKIDSVKKLPISLNEEYLTEAFQLAKLAFWEYEVENKFFVMNQDFANLLGIPFNEDCSSLDMNYCIQNYLFDEDKTAFELMFQRMIEDALDDELNLFEYRVKKGGDPKDLITILKSVRVKTASDGRVIGLYGTVQDITTIKESERELEQYRNKLELLVKKRTEELKRSEEMLTDALNIARLGTWNYDFKTDTFSIGGVVVGILGLDTNSTHNYSLPFEEFKNYIHPDDWEKYHQAAIKAVKSTDKEYLDYIQYRIIRPDGAVRQLLISIKIEFNELTAEHTRHFGTMQDITDIQQREHENRRLTEIIEATSDIVGVINTDQGIDYLNKSARDFFGIRANQNINELSLFDLISPEQHERIKKQIDQAIHFGASSSEQEYVGHDKEALPVSQVILSHRDAAGKLEYLSTIIRDISLQKETERSLIYKNHELDTFVYRASHDLRGPITSLYGLLNIAKYDVTEPKSIEYLALLEAQVNRLNTIIANLMELTKIKEKDLQFEVIDFNKLVKDSINAFNHLPYFDEIDFKIEIDDRLSYSGDVGIISTIIQNLIENGIKYSRMEINSFIRIQIKHFVPNNTLHIKVTDNGQGIPEDHLDKIFNMFFRGNESAMGTGLGLYILKNAVERLKGKISVNSKVNQGTVFSIFVPFED